MRNVTVRQLRVFATVAKRMSFARAAEELHLTPPAVSMQIRELEEQVTLPLFDRTGRTVSLTVTGEYFLVYVRRVLATLRDAEDAIANFRGLEAGRLTVGMVSTAQYYVPLLLAKFRREHPRIEIRITVGNRESLVQQLQRNEVDLAIMGRPPREIATRAEPFGAHPLVVIAAPDHPLAALDHVPLAALAAHAFIVREPGSGTRAAMEHFFRDHRIDPPIAMELESNDTIKQAVIAGMGISFLSLHTLGLELGAGLLKVLDVDDLPLVRRWHVVHTLSKMLSPPAEALRYFILEEGERFLAERFGALGVP
ncbi:MAG: LysR substrate-binding domain-containing protein [Betaproteobacteria bacterium]